MLGKGPTLGADMVFIDLEDSVSPLEKEAARGKVVNAINTLDWGETRAVRARERVGHASGPYRDVIEVVGGRGRAARRDHAAEGADRGRGASRWTCCSPRSRRHGLASRHIGIEAQIETARGLINVNEICAASRRLETIILGPVDMSASMEMPVLAGGLEIPEYPGDYFHYVFVQDPHGRSRQRPAGDRRSVREGARPRRASASSASARRSSATTASGRCTPTRCRSSTSSSRRPRSSSTRRGDILETYEKATTEGDRKGAVMLGDEMIDEATPQGRGEARQPRRARRDAPQRELNRARGALQPGAAARASPTAGSRSRSGSWSRAAGEGRRPLRDRREQARGRRHRARAVLERDRGRRPPVRRTRPRVADARAPPTPARSPTTPSSTASSSTSSETSNRRRLMASFHPIERRAGSAQAQGVLGEAAGDDAQAERLVGAFEDRQHPGVDEEARHRELLGVAHAAVELHRLAGDPLGGAAHVRLHHRRFERALAGAILRATS